MRNYGLEKDDDQKRNEIQVIEDIEKTIGSWLKTLSKDAKKVSTRVDITF